MQSIYLILELVNQTEKNVIANQYDVPDSGLYLWNFW